MDRRLRNQRLRAQAAIVQVKREGLDDAAPALKLQHQQSWPRWYTIDPADAVACYEALQADMLAEASFQPSRGRAKHDLLYEVAVSNRLLGARVVFYLGCGPLKRFSDYTGLGYGPFVDAGPAAASSGLLRRLLAAKQQFWMWLQINGCCFHYRFATVATAAGAMKWEGSILAKVDYGSNAQKNGDYCFADIAGLVSPAWSSPRACCCWPARPPGPPGGARAARWSGAGGGARREGEHETQVDVLMFYGLGACGAKSKAVRGRVRGAGNCPGLRTAVATPPSTRMPGDTNVATGGATGRASRNWNGARRSATDKARGNSTSAPFLPGNQPVVLF
jgi:hypothetical protein